MLRFLVINILLLVVFVVKRLWYEQQIEENYLNYLGGNQSEFDEILISTTEF